MLCREEYCSTTWLFHILSLCPLMYSEAVPIFWLLRTVLSSVLNHFSYISSSSVRFPGNFKFYFQKFMYFIFFLRGRETHKQRQGKRALSRWLTLPGAYTGQNGATLEPGQRHASQVFRMSGRDASAWPNCCLWRGAESRNGEQDEDSSPASSARTVHIFATTPHVHRCFAL